MTTVPRHSLDTLQRWLQTVVMHPGGVVAGAQSQEARLLIDVPPDGFDSVVTRSQALSAIERLEIYNRAYFSRLLECLREEYSVLAAALEDDLFDAFALGYLQEHPSQTYTLAKLGDGFPEYLAATRPATATDTDANWPEFLIDLARLERTVNEVFDGPGAEGQSLLDHERMRAIAPERWPDAQLVCVPCLRLLALSYPVNDFFTAVRRRESPAVPESAAAWVAVTRHDYRVLRYPLVAAQYELLGALQAGATVAEAITLAAAVSTLPDEQFAIALRDWFYRWTAEGFFLDVRWNTLEVHLQ
ncbi:MAG: DUF2063 domain-containing protein [Planctomycetaceae bacterium]|nr:DUF2063 domain-containing protein [Planctomycetaceae bacterium]